MFLYPNEVAVIVLASANALVHNRLLRHRIAGLEMTCEHVVK